MPGGGVYYMWRSCLLFMDITKAIHPIRSGNGMDPVEFAVNCEQSGCDGIVLQSGQDRPSMDAQQISDIRAAVRIPVNLQIPLESRCIDVAGKVKPDKVILTPDTQGPAGGWDVDRTGQKIRDAVLLFHQKNILVSILVTSDMKVIEQAGHVGADFVLIHTGGYAGAEDGRAQDKEIRRIYRAADLAVQADIKVSAGGGLTRDNILPVLKTRALEGVTVGSAVIDRSETVGLSRAVEEILDLVD